MLDIPRKSRLFLFGIESRLMLALSFQSARVRFWGLPRGLSNRKKGLTALLNGVFFSARLFYFLPTGQRPYGVFFVPSKFGRQVKPSLSVKSHHLIN